MGWRELRAWMRAYNRAVKRENDGAKTDPGSWDGAEQDPAWKAMHDKREQLRRGM